MADMDSRVNEQYISFRICEKGEQILYRREIVRLQRDEINAFAFQAVYYDGMGREHSLGMVKMGKQGAKMDQLPQEFTQLPKGWFSLGQDEDYYENISALDSDTRCAILEALRDLAYYPEELDALLKDASNEEICREFLARIAPAEKVAVAKVKGQFHKMTRGGARLTPYHFTYTAPVREGVRPVQLTFDVAPQPYPPTNVHALIGRNGCGKTYLIRNMVQCLQNDKGDFGTFTYEDKEGIMREFVNVICVAFSPFDDFAALIQKNGTMPATFVGLDKTKGDLLESIFEQFWGHFSNCIVTERKQSLWKRAIEILVESDEQFEREEIDRLMDDLTPGSSKEMLDSRRSAAKAIFEKLSSGHKVVLLIITSCVAEVEERSILFLDEPENHLHPPLLSALIRVLSDLMMDRNGVAIISTHSPIVLQEIPKSCVWVLKRNYKNEVRAFRPIRETFGTNLSALIYDTFDLDMDRSGFRKLIQDAADELSGYDDVREAFDGHLGNEAVLLLRTLIMLQERGIS